MKNTREIIDMIEPLNQDTLCGVSVFKGTGWTCFLNACMQCISHCPDISHMLIHQHNLVINRLLSNMSISDHNIACVILYVIREVLSNNVLVGIDGLIDLICKKSNFKHGEQQDAHECYQLLLEQLSMSLSREIKNDISPSFEKLTDPVELIEIAKKSLPGTNSAINDIFNGQTMNVRKCLSCTKIYGTFSNFRELILTPPSHHNDRINIIEMLQEFIKPTRPCDFKCECEAINSVTQSKLWTLPRILVMKLNKNNISQETVFPEILDITDFTGNDMYENVRYELFSVCYHLGTSICGHYYTRSKDEYTGKWHIFNDSFTIPCTLSDVLSETSRVYMLFYRRTNTDWVDI